MSQKLWTAVDRYISEKMIGPDEALEAAVKASRAASLPNIAVAPNQGKLLHLMAKMVGARRILEIGTLGGYSAIWLARALPEGGKLITLEYSPKHAEVARANLARAGLSEVAEVITGPASETLPKLQGPFDFIFIDADKPSYADYFRWALKLSRKGTAIVVDNVVRDGEVIDPKGDAAVQGVRRLNDLVASEPRVSATTIQTVGVKGHDGWLIAVVLDG
jgi:predicted O-methyltransferase YrrM